MTDFATYKEHIQHTHNAFCRVVIRHAAIDAARRVHKRREREISLDYLIDEKYYPFSTTDEYFAEPAPDIDYPFTVCGQTVLLSNPILAAALPLLSEHEQEVIFLYFFQRQTQKEIGKRYGRTRSTTRKPLPLSFLITPDISVTIP